MSISKYVRYLSTSLIASALICGISAQRLEAFGQQYEPSPESFPTRIYPPGAYSKESPSQATRVEKCELFGGRSCYEYTVELPNDLRDLIIQSITQESGVAPIGLKVIRSQHVTWSNGCGASYQPDMICSMMLVPDWRVTVEDSMFRRNYSIGYSSVFLVDQENITLATIYSSVFLMSKERINQTTDLELGSGTGQPVPEPGTVLGSLSALAVAIGMRKFSKRKTNPHVSS